MLQAIENWQQMISNSISCFVVRSFTQQDTSESHLLVKLSTSYASFEYIHNITEWNVSCQYHIIIDIVKASFFAPVGHAEWPRTYFSRTARSGKSRGSVPCPGGPPTRRATSRTRCGPPRWDWEWRRSRRRRTAPWWAESAATFQFVSNIGVKISPHVGLHLTFCRIGNKTKTVNV